jgi:hypothetical protein
MCQTCRTGGLRQFKDALLCFGQSLFLLLLISSEAIRSNLRLLLSSCVFLLQTPTTTASGSST